MLLTDEDVFIREGGMSPLTYPALSSASRKSDVNRFIFTPQCAVRPSRGGRPINPHACLGAVSRADHATGRKINCGNIGLLGLVEH